MKDPFYAKIMFGIESIIHEYDEKSDGKLKESTEYEPSSIRVKVQKRHPPKVFTGSYFE